MLERTLRSPDPAGGCGALPAPSGWSILDVKTGSGLSLHQGTLRLSMRSTIRIRGQQDGAGGKGTSVSYHVVRDSAEAVSDTHCSQGSRGERLQA